MSKQLAMVWTLVVGVAASLGSGAPMLLCVGADGHIDRKSSGGGCARACPSSPDGRYFPPLSATPDAVDSPECCLDVPVAGEVSILVDQPSQPLTVRADLQACPAVAPQVARLYPCASSTTPAAETSPLSHRSLHTAILLI